MSAPGEEVESGRKVGLAHFMRALKIKLRKPVGNSLADLWIRRHASTARNTGSVPGWGIKIPCAVQPKEKIKIKMIRKQVSLNKLGWTGQRSLMRG